MDDTGSWQILLVIFGALGDAVEDLIPSFLSELSTLL